MSTSPHHFRVWTPTEHGIVEPQPATNTTVQIAGIGSISIPILPGSETLNDQMRLSQYLSKNSTLYEFYSDYILLAQNSLTGIQIATDTGLSTHKRVLPPLPERQDTIEVPDVPVLSPSALSMAS